jgi:hypothetical protein
MRAAIVVIMIGRNDADQHDDPDEADCPCGTPPDAP